MAELEKELGLALGEQQVESSAGTPTSQSPRSAEAPQDEIQSREYTETSSSRPEELHDVSRHGIAPGLEEWKWRETEVVEGEREGEGEGEGAAIQQEKEHTAAQKDELGQSVMGECDLQDFIEVVNVDNPKDKEAIVALPTTQPEIPEPRFRLRGIRGRQTGTTQYRVVWGRHLEQRLLPHA
jgi:hypothetical protein